MDDETIVLVSFLLLPVLLLIALLLLIRKYKQHPNRGSWVGLVAGNTLVFGLFCSIALAGGEVYYRYYYDTTDSFGLSKTTKKWFERHFQTNNSPFRDSLNYTPEIPADKKRRVTFIGDSFTAGHGIPDVEDRFANQIRAADPLLDVHVLAQCGWDTGMQLVLASDPTLQQNGYQWDLVVLVYCLNDIADIVPEWKEILDRLYNAPRPGYLVEHSYFANTLYYRWKAGRDPDVSNYYQFVRNNYEGPIWDEQQQRLKSLRDKVQSQDGKLLVVTFPFLHALGADYEYQSIHTRLDEFWRGLEVPHLDMLSVYQSCDPKELVVNAYDAHPNVRAHKMAAEHILKFLEKHR